MDREVGNEEVKTDTETVVTADSFNKEAISPAPDNGHEGIPAEKAASAHEGENSKSMKDTKNNPDEEKATSEPEAIIGHELSAADFITRQGLAVKINEVIGWPATHEERAVEIDCNHDNEHPRLHLERENSTPAQEEEPTAGPADKEDISCEECLILLQELREEQDEANQRSSQLQMELAEYYSRKARDDSQPVREPPESEQLQEHKRLMNVLKDLKQQRSTEAENAQQQAEQLSLLSQEKLETDITVRELSRHLGKKAAQAKVTSILATQQLPQHALVKLHLENGKLSLRIGHLEAKLRDWDEQAKDPLHLQCEWLQAERLEQKKHGEKQNEVSLKVQNKISGHLELLSNIREKLFWSQTEVQAKQEQLLELEATVAQRRVLLTRTKQAHSNLQSNNLRLKQQRGLLGDSVLMRDFDNTLDASNLLEEQLEERPAG